MKMMRMIKINVRHVFGFLKKEAQASVTSLGPLAQ